MIDWESTRAEKTRVLVRVVIVVLRIGARPRGVVVLISP